MLPLALLEGISVGAFAAGDLRLDLEPEFPVGFTPLLGELPDSEVKDALYQPLGEVEPIVPFRYQLGVGGFPEEFGRAVA